MAMYRSLALLALLCTAVVANVATAPPPPVDCSLSFNDLMPCIDFVNSNSSGPPAAPCCAAFSTTQKQHPECLCQLEQAFTDPATAPGNATKAAEIPVFCNVAVDYNKCPALLGLAPEPSPAPVRPPHHAPVPAPSPAPRTGKDFDCTNAFNDLASCLGFVSGDGKGGPPKDCCTAIGNTQAKEPICLCQLLAQVNDSAQYGVNATLAMELPTLCHVNADTSRCPALLNNPIGAPSPARAPASPTVSPPAHAPVPAPVRSPPALAPALVPAIESIDCSNEFGLLQSCFPYVMANDTTPPSVECCNSLGSVVKNKPVCLCQLLQTVGSGDPAVSGINATRALGLADVCKVTTDVGMCPALLGQPVLSPLPSSPSTGEAPGSPSGDAGGEAPISLAPAPTPSGASSSVSSSSSLVVSCAAIFWSVALNCL